MMISMILFRNKTTKKRSATDNISTLYYIRLEMFLIINFNL